MAGKPFFPKLIKYMSSGPVVPMVGIDYTDIDYFYHSGTSITSFFHSVN